MSDFISRVALLDAMPKNDELSSLYVRRVICDAPAVDVGPVLHAKYIHVGPSSKGGVDWYRCSNCGTLESGVYVQHPFCSICGAKMDEGEQNVTN